MLGFEEIGTGCAFAVPTFTLFSVQVGHEIGTSTGRTRRCGWLDLVVVKYTSRINGYSSINVTKLDVLTNIPGGVLKIAVAYK